MKHLKKIFESQKDKELEMILNTFVGVSDAFGEPRVESQSYLRTGKLTYELSWVVLEEIGSTGWIEVDHLVNTNIRKIFNNSNLLIGIKDDLLSAKGRLSSNFKMDVCFKNNLNLTLSVRLMPVKVLPVSNFLNRLENDTLYFNKADIENFFSKEIPNIEVRASNQPHQFDFYDKQMYRNIFAIRNKTIANDRPRIRVPILYGEFTELLIAECTNKKIPITFVVNFDHVQHIISLYSEEYVKIVLI